MLFCGLCHKKMSCPRLVGGWEGGRICVLLQNLCISLNLCFMKELRARNSESCGNYM